MCILTFPLQTRLKKHNFNICCMSTWSCMQRSTIILLWGRRNKNNVSVNYLKLLFLKKSCKVARGHETFYPHFPFTSLCMCRLTVAGFLLYWTCVWSHWWISQLYQVRFKGSALRSASVNVCIDGSILQAHMTVNKLLHTQSIQSAACVCLLHLIVEAHWGAQKISPLLIIFNGKRWPLQRDIFYYQWMWMNWCIVGLWLMGTNRHNKWFIQIALLIVLYTSLCNFNWSFITFYFKRTCSGNATGTIRKR